MFFQVFPPWKPSMKRIKWWGSAQGTGELIKWKAKENFEPGMVIKAGVTIFADGTRVPLFKRVCNKLKLRKGKNPEVFELGVKEVIQLPEGRGTTGEVITPWVSHDKRHRRHFHLRPSKRPNRGGSLCLPGYGRPPS